MFVPECLLGEGKQAPVERLSLGVLALLSVKARQRMKRYPDIGVVRTLRLFLDGKHPFSDRGRLGIFALLIEFLDLCTESGGIILCLRGTSNHDPEQRPGYQRQ